MAVFYAYRYEKHTMSSGAKVQLAWIKEVTPGVTPAGDWDVLTRISNGLIPTYNSEENNEIGFTRMSQGTAQTTGDVGGDIETKWRYGALDEFLASCFGKAWLGNVLTMGDDRITFSIAFHATDIGVSSIARGVQVATMNFDFPGDNISFIINAQPESSQRRFSFKDISGLRINAVQVGEDNACVDRVHLQFDNAVQTQRCIGNSNPYPGNIIATTFTPSGSTTISWSKMAFELWKKQQVNDAISLEFTIGNADGGYNFLIPEMEITADWPDGGSTDIIQVELNYAARRVAPTVTRLPTPIVDDQRKELAQLLGEINPAVAALARLDDMQVKLAKLKKAGTVESDTFVEYTDRINTMRDASGDTTDTMNKAGMSAKAYSAALRNVPAQFTDIAVSLQSDQAPLTVLLPQGGQLKDMFGGIGSAAQALGGYILGLVPEPDHWKDEEHQQALRRGGAPGQGCEREAVGLDDRQRRDAGDDHRREAANP